MVENDSRKLVCPRYSLESNVHTIKKKGQIKKTQTLSKSKLQHIFISLKLIKKKKTDMVWKFVRQ